MFFLERASVFDFSLGGNNNLFYSRRISLSDDGDPVRIYGGARITGRLKKWDVGFIDMQTAALLEKSSSGDSREVLPSENFGVLRLRRQIINENTYIGAMATSRLGTNGKYNLTYGIDGIFRLFGDDYLDIKWSQTFDDSTSNKSIKEPSIFTVNWQRRATKGLGYELGYTQSGVHFNPGVGFEMIDDYAAVTGEIRYGWMPGENSKLYLHSPQSMMFYRTYIDDGTRISVQLEPTWNISKHFEPGGTYNFDHVNFSKRNLIWTNHIVGLKTLYMLNIKFSVNAFIQYNKAVHEIITNLRIRYNPKEGNDLYLVFNEGRNTNLKREVPNLPVYYSRAVMIKYTYTFNL